MELSTEKRYALTDRADNTTHWLDPAKPLQYQMPAEAGFDVMEIDGEEMETAYFVGTDVETGAKIRQLLPVPWVEEVEGS